MLLRPITPDDDQALARIIRSNLTEHGLDIPGTAFFDEELDHLSTYYAADPTRRRYCVAQTAQGTVVGGVGLAEVGLFPNCAELQKLYLDNSVKGRGFGYMLMERIEQEARRLGYQRMYLETHTNLPVALHLYERCGYVRIPQPAGIQHATMNRFYIKELGEDASVAPPPSSSLYVKGSLFA